MKSYTINLNLLFYIIIVYSFYQPFLLTQVGFLPIINKILLVYSLLILVFIHLIKFPNIKLSRGIIALTIFYLSILISTILNNSISFDFFQFIGMSLAFGLLINYSLNERSEFLNLLFAINTLIYIYIVINFFLMLMFPEGLPQFTKNPLNPYYFFGNKNSVVKYALPGLCFSFLYDVLKYNKIRKRSWILLLLVWITLLKSQAVTAIIGLFVFTTLLILKPSSKRSFYIYNSMFIGSIILSVFLIFFKGESNLLTSILNFLEKDITLSGREHLWENAIEIIKYSPIWGYGYQGYDFYEYYIGNRYGTHNYYLDILLRGGFVSLSLFCFTIIYLSKKIVKSKSTLATLIIVVTCCSYFIMWAAEPFIDSEDFMFSIIFVLISRLETLSNYCCKKISEEKDHYHYLKRIRFLVR